MQTNYITRLGVCTLNQWAMDFELNKAHIVDSIIQCKKHCFINRGCTYRLGPELEICGYGCEDHFLENDTVQHCWEVVCEILKSDLTNNIVCDLGMPVIHKNVYYNCRLILLNQRIHLIRPKQYLADDGNYHESRFGLRWFTPWSKEDLEEFHLPAVIQSVLGQMVCPIGVAILKALDSEIGIEMCEELWVPQPTSTLQALDGAEIIVNSSGSYFQMRKLQERTDLLVDITKRNGAVYMFSNLRGCDGSRVYYDGLCVVAVNGNIYKRTEFFSLKDVEVIMCDVDLQDVRNQRINLKARSLQASKSKHFKRIPLDIQLTQIQFLEKLNVNISLAISEEEQVSQAIGCYLWDYLRRSGANGYFLPLSGGIDSCASAVFVYHMATKVFQTIQTQDEQNTSEKVLKELRTILKDDQFHPNSVEDIMKRIFFTSYLGSENSTNDTKQRAKHLSEQLGHTHFEVDINGILESFVKSIKVLYSIFCFYIIKQPVFPNEPKFEQQGGSPAEDLALQNIQARSRMVLSYLIASLIPWKEEKKVSLFYLLIIQGFLLVLGSANLDESLRGYLTKYDCSSADINPLGSLTKNDIRKMLDHTAKKYNFPIIQVILNAGSSPELRPAQANQTIHGQNSESEMGMSFDELETFGKLRKLTKLGPFSMFRQLQTIWPTLKPRQIADKVKKFFMYYAINRHKLVTLTPAIHAEVK